MREFLYLATPWVILFSVKKKTLTLHKKWSFPLKISSVNVTKSAGNCEFGQNLSLDLHDVSIFWLKSDKSSTLSLNFSGTCLKLRDQPWRFKYFQCRNIIWIELTGFWGMVNRRKAFSLISSRDHCQRSWLSRISDTPRAWFEPALNLSSGFDEWSCAVVITTTPWRLFEVIIFL